MGLSAVVLPGVALAANTIDDASQNTVDALTSLTGAVNAVIPFLVAIAVVVFIYGVIKYVLASGPEDKAASRSLIIYGIIGIAVILSIFGLVKLVQSTFGLTTTNLTGNDIPKITP